MIKRIRQLHNRLVASGYAAATALVAPEVFAQVPTSGPTLGAISKNVNSSLGDVSRLAEGIAYTAGFFLALGAMFKFKAYRDNPQQTPLGVPLTWLGVAVGLFALPMLIGGGMSTLFGAGTAVNTVRQPGL